MAAFQQVQIIPEMRFRIHYALLTN